MRKLLKRFVIIPLIISITFLVIGLVIIFKTNYIKQNYIKTTAVVTKDILLHDDHDLYVSYEINGEQFIDVPINFNMGSWKNGSTIEIYVNPDNLTKLASVQVNMILFYVFMPIGDLFLVLALFFNISLKRKDRINYLLKQNGQKVILKIKEIVNDKRVQVNGKYPYYRIICEYNGNTYLSDMTKDISNIKIGDEVTMYLGIKKYFIDLSTIVASEFDYFEKEWNITMTSFEPFGGRSINISNEVVKRISNVDKRLIPVVWDDIEIELDAILARKPDLLILCGEAGSYDKVTIETLAHNICKGIDNNGVERYSESIIIDGNNELTTNVNLPNLDDLNLRIGYDAGKYLCNYTYYLALSKTKDTKVIFIHYPVPKDNEKETIEEYVNLTERVIEKIKGNN